MADRQVRPLILDLFCGAGLVHDGLVAAGLRPVGVDIEPQPSYPGAFVQHDALALDPRFLDLFSYIWASPPCLKESVLASSARREEVVHGYDETAHPDLITPTQRMLDAWSARTGGKFVIENVQNTKLLRDPVVLCGSMFGLSVEDAGRTYYLERHRKFEANWNLTQPWHPPHPKPCVGVYGGHARVRAASAGGRKTADPWTCGHQPIMQRAMGVDRYLTVDELGQGIPPIYAQHVAEEMLRR